MVIRSCINWLYSHPIETQQHNRVLWLFSNTQIFNFYCYISSVVSWTPATSYNKAQGYSTTELCIWPPQHLRFKGPRAGKGDQDWINIMEPTMIAHNEKLIQTKGAIIFLKSHSHRHLLLFLNVSNNHLTMYR